MIEILVQKHDNCLVGIVERSRGYIWTPMGETEQELKEDFRRIVKGFDSEYWNNIDLTDIKLTHVKHKGWHDKMREISIKTWDK